MKAFLLLATMMVASTCFGQDAAGTVTFSSELSTKAITLKAATFVGDSGRSTLWPIQPQQVDRWCIGNFCVDATAAVGSPVVTVTPPTRNGKLALLSDIVAGPAPAQSPRAHGKITLVNGAGSAILTGFTAVPDCFVQDASGNSVRYANTMTVLTVSGIGPVLVWHCEQ